jgi:type IV secretion system protein TrbL
MLGDIESSFQGNLVSAGNAMAHAAGGIFWSLATISFIWSMGQLAIKAADLGEIMSELIRFVITTGIFWFILQNGSQIALAISQSFGQLATSAGAGGLTKPDGVMSAAGKIWFDSISALSLYSLGGQAICTTIASHYNLANIGQGFKAVGQCELDITFGTVLMLLSFLATYIVLVIVAIDMLILRITLYLVIYLGLILLGFGGMRRSEDMAIGYLKTVGSVAIANMTMSVIAFLGLTFVKTETATMVATIKGFFTAFAGGTTTDISTVPLLDCAEGLISALVVLFLIKRVPHILGQMVGGVNAASQVSGAGGALVGAAFAGVSAAGAAVLTAGASMAAGAAAKGVEATKAGAAMAGGEAGAAAGAGGGGGGGGGMSGGGMSGGGGGSSVGAGGSMSPMARASGDSPLRGMPPIAANDGGSGGADSGMAGQFAGGDAMSAEQGGGEGGGDVGDARRVAPGADAGSGVRSGQSGGSGSAGLAAGLVAAGTALKVAGGAGQAAVAFHDGRNPVSGLSGQRTGGASRSASPTAAALSAGQGSSAASPSGDGGGSGTIGGDDAGSGSGGGVTPGQANDASAAGGGSRDAGTTSSPDALAPARFGGDAPNVQTQDGVDGNQNAQTGQGPTQVTASSPLPGSIDAAPGNDASAVGGSTSSTPTGRSVAGGGSARGGTASPSPDALAPARFGTASGGVSAPASPRVTTSLGNAPAAAPAHGFGGASLSSGGGNTGSTSGGDATASPSPDALAPARFGATSGGASAPSASVAATPYTSIRAPDSSPRAGGDAPNVETQDGVDGNQNARTGQGPTQISATRPASGSIDATPLNNAGQGSIKPGDDGV